MECLPNAQSSSTTSDLDDPLEREAGAKRAHGFNEGYDGLTFESESMPLARIIVRIYCDVSSPQAASLHYAIKEDVHGGRGWEGAS